MVTVSALMPTYNRREFVPRSISCFLSQQYPTDWYVELVILDDGTDSIKNLLPDDSRIKYFYELPKRNHGEKMNRCFELSNGEIGIVWDDDDVYAANRISRQILPFIENPSIQITGSTTLYYYTPDKRAFQYTSPSTIGWMASIAVRKSYWEGNRFDSILAGADYNILKQIPQESRCDLNDPTLIVASVHPNNACKKSLGREYAPVPWATVAGLLGE
jgi:glycosyltransferase involved in cell wall biosynthesis